MSVTEMESDVSGKYSHKNELGNNGEEEEGKDVFKCRVESSW